MKYFVFNQNNSGGVFFGHKFVIVEANTSEVADTLAANADVYFDGCATGSDCQCCGDRWHRSYDGDSYDSLQDAIKHCREWCYNPDRSDTIGIVSNDGAVTEEKMLT